MLFSRTQIAAGVTLLSLGGLTGAALSAGGGTDASSAAPHAASAPVVTQVVTQTVRRVRHVRTRVYRRARRPASGQVHVAAAPRAIIAVQPSPSQSQAAAAPSPRPALAVVRPKPAPASKPPITDDHSSVSGDDRVQRGHDRPERQQPEDQAGLDD